MRERYDDLRQCLKGLTKEMPDAVFCLARILECHAFELCEDKTSGDYMLPYMMNDALEYYLIMKECRLTGAYLQEEKILSAEIIYEGFDAEQNCLAKKNNRYVLILRQENGNVCTLYFKEIQESVQCYQYHRIGHFWVKGQERWRQLVYKIGTIYDKYEYFEERFCNDKEKALRDLILFAPFHYWSPINEPLDQYYPNAEEGLEVMERLARESGDRRYLGWLGIYKAASLPLLKKWMTKFMAKQLLKPERQKLYEIIYQKVCEASLEYPERDYGDTVNRWMEEERSRIDAELKKDGYTGAYPEYEKDGKRMIAMEEHPFTVMESERYKFRIQLMKVM